MKLTERSGEETTTHMKSTMPEERKRKTEAPAKKEKEAQKEKEEEVKKEEDEGFGDVVNDGFSDMEPAVSYCGEGWHSVCNFFVKFLDG